MTKRKIIFLNLLIIFFTSVVIANEYSWELKNVPNEYLGTYLPVDYINLLQEYKCHKKALKEIAPTHYDVLYLKESICYSQVLYEDGYAVQTKDFEKWTFKTEKNEKYITDENGYLYRRISSSTEGHPESEFVLSYFFGLFPDANVLIKENTVKIGNKVYEIDMHLPGSGTPECSFMLSFLDMSGKEPYAERYFVFIEEKGFKIIRGEYDETRAWKIDLTDEVVYSYCE